MSRTYAQWRALLEGRRLPLAVVDLDAFDRNADRIAERARALPAGTTVRVASKSLRVPRLLRRVLERGRPFAGVMCYSAREAELLASRGLDDLLLAYPTAQRAEIDLMLKLHTAGKEVRAVVDSGAGVELWRQAAAGGKVPFPLVIELDASLRPLGGAVHLGVRRSPVRDSAAVRALVADLGRDDTLRFGGLMAYEAQVAGLADRNPFARALNPAVRLVRGWSRRRVARLRRRVARDLQAVGTNIDVFNGGGTGSLGFAADEPWLTEVTVGSGFTCPHFFDYFSNLELEPALFFALQVVRQPDPGYVTCQGGGFVASGDPGWHRVPKPWLPDGVALLPAEACGEVQTPLRGVGTAVLQLGDPVLFRHAKAGELAEHFDEYLLIEGGEVVGHAPTYRGLGCCFP